MGDMTRQEAREILQKFHDSVKKFDDNTSNGSCLTTTTILQSMQTLIDDGWVSVEDGLPSINQRVLVYGYSGTIRIVNRCKNAANYNEWRSDDKKLKWSINSFSHWRYLPQPPKEKGTDNEVY